MRKFKFNLTHWVFGGMFLGILLGSLIFYFGGADKEFKLNLVSHVSVLGDIFLNLIKMVIAPLVFCLLTTGIAKIGDLGSIGRIGMKAMTWFILASLLSLSIGLMLMNIFDASAYIAQPPQHVDSNIINQVHGKLNLRDFILHIFPKSIVDAMAHNEVLQVVVFAVFFGVAAATLPKDNKIVTVLSETGDVLLKIITYVMYLSPLAAFSTIFCIISVQGPSVLKLYVFLLLIVIGGLILLWVILNTAAFLFIGRRVFDLLRACKVPFILAFSTSSSESAYPLIIKELEKFGCHSKIIRFVLPLGYSFNLDGSIMYTSIATLFIAQVYGIDLSLGTQIMLMFFLMITSKGIAGVPRASLVIIAGALTAFDIPEAGLTLLLGVDALLDMGRSVTNIMGNTIATTVISKLENSLEDPTDKLTDAHL